VDTTLLRPIYAYNTWANENIRRALERAGEERARRPLGLWFESVYAICAHICGGEQLWLRRLQGEQLQYLPGAGDYPTLDRLLAEWREADAAWEEYIASVPPALLADVAEYPTQYGDTLRFARWQVLLHVPFHSAEHRAHAATGLTLLGVRHGPLDFHVQFMPPESIALRWPDLGAT